MRGNFLHVGMPSIRGVLINYRLDDESRCLQDLDHRGNKCIDVPSVDNDSSSNVF